MNTLHFKYAVEIERTGSITQAADNLYMSQPNLSKAMKELEETLHITIFQRTSKGVIPTEKGAEFLRYAKNILGQLQAMENLYQPDSEAFQRVRMALPSSFYIADGFLKFGASLRGDDPIELRCTECSAMQALTLLTEEQIRLAVIRIDARHEQYFSDFLRSRNLDHLFVWEYDDVLLLREEHPLCAEEQLSIAQLSRYPELIPYPESVPFLPVSEIPSAVPPPSGLMQCPARDMQLTLLQALDAYLWSAPVTLDFCRRNHLTARNCIDQSRHFKDLLVFPHRSQFGAAEKRFIDCLYDARNSVAFQ